MYFQFNAIALLTSLVVALPPPSAAMELVSQIKVSPAIENLANTAKVPAKDMLVSAKTGVVSHPISVDALDAPIQSTNMIKKLVLKTGDGLKGVVSTVPKVISGAKGVAKGIGQVVIDTKDLVGVMIPKTVQAGEGFHPMRTMGLEMQEMGLKQSATDFLAEKLTWIPDNMKDPVKSFISSTSRYAMNAICRGKIHSNIRIRNLAMIAQKHMAALNNKMPFHMAMKSIDIICASQSI